MSIRQSPLHLVTLGDLVADLIVPVASLPIEAGQHQRADWMRLEAGGTSNTLVMAVRLGLKTVVIGAMGNDHAGHHVMSILQGEHVQLDGLILVENQKTPTSLVLVDRRGDHVFVGALDAATPIPFQANWPSILLRARALFTTGYAMHPLALFGPDNNLQCMTIARSGGCRIFMDLGPSAFIDDPERVAEALALSDVVLATAEELCQWTDLADPVQAAHRIRATGPDTVVVKTGPDGCIIVKARKEVICPGFQVEFRDSVGAGDAFAAGYIAAVLAGRDDGAAGRTANAVGAAAVTRVGTGSLLPARKEVAALLAPEALPIPPERKGQC